jgi:hypothetical protein
MDTTDASRPKHSRTDHSEHLSLFGPPPIFDGEDMENYNQLLTGFSTAIRPAEIFEDIWVRGAHDLTIEVLRLRRLKVNLIRANEYQGLTEALTPLVDRSQAETLAEGVGCAQIGRGRADQ